MRTAHIGKQQACIHMVFETFSLWIMNRLDCAEGEVYTPNISNMNLGSMQMIKLV